MGRGAPCHNDRSSPPRGGAPCHDGKSSSHRAQGHDLMWLLGMQRRAHIPTPQIPIDVGGRELGASGAAPAPVAGPGPARGRGGGAGEKPKGLFFPLFGRAALGYSRVPRVQFQCVSHMHGYRHPPKTAGCRGRGYPPPAAGAGPRRAGARARAWVPQGVPHVQCQSVCVTPHAWFPGRGTRLHVQVAQWRSDAFETQFAHPGR